MKTQVYHPRYVKEENTIQSNLNNKRAFFPPKIRQKKLLLIIFKGKKVLFLIQVSS